MRYSLFYLVKKTKIDTMTIKHNTVVVSIFIMYYDIDKRVIKPYFKEEDNMLRKQLTTTSPVAQDDTRQVEQMNFTPSAFNQYGTSVYNNPNAKFSGKDMLGAASFLSQPVTGSGQVNPLEVLVAQDGPTVITGDVEAIYEGCKKLIIKGQKESGYFQYHNLLVNYGKLLLNQDTYKFAYPFLGYNRNEVHVFVTKYRCSNALLEFNKPNEFNEECFTVGTLCSSSMTVQNYFYIAWAEMKDFRKIINCQ